MKLSDENRARMVDKIIRLAADSMESHLPYTHDCKEGDLIRDETTDFHKICVQEYAKIIYLASRLY